MGRDVRGPSNLKKREQRAEGENLRKGVSPPGQFYDQKGQMLPHLSHSTLVLVLLGDETRLQTRAWKKSKGHLLPCTWLRGTKAL